MQILRKTLASLYRKKGQLPMKNSDLVFFASMDLRWFTPSQARSMVKVALENGLLGEDGDRLIPGFDVDEIEPELDFKPDVSALLAEMEELDGARMDGAGKKDENSRKSGSGKEEDAPEKKESVAGREDTQTTGVPGEPGKGADTPKAAAANAAAREEENSKAAVAPDAGCPDTRDASTGKTGTPGKPSKEKTALFREIVARITEKGGVEKRVVVAETNKTKRKFGNIDMAAAALVVARKYGVEMGDLLEKAEKVLLDGGT